MNKERIDQTNCGKGRYPTGPPKQLELRTQMQFLSLICFSLSIGFLYSLCILWLMYITWNMVAKSAWVSHLTTLQRNSFAIIFSERNLGKRFGHQVSNFGQTNHGQEVVHSVWFNCLLWTEWGYRGNWLLVERQLRKAVPRRKRDAFVRRECGG